jgi:hypothetical protein
MTTVNPMVTVLLIGERAADLVAGKEQPCHES